MKVVPLLVLFLASGLSANENDVSDWGINWSSICKNGGRPAFTSSSEDKSPKHFDRCRCSALWEGTYCDYIRCFYGRRIRRDECQCDNGTVSRHCLKDGFCGAHGQLVVDPNIHTADYCNCEDGFTGSRCELITSCGTHGQLTTAGVCDCESNWHGVRCTQSDKGLPVAILLPIAVLPTAFVVVSVICIALATGCRRRADRRRRVIAQRQTRFDKLTEEEQPLASAAACSTPKSVTMTETESLMSTPPLQPQLSTLIVTDGSGMRWGHARRPNGCANPFECDGLGVSDSDEQQQDIIGDLFRGHETANGGYKKDAERTVYVMSYRSDML